MRKFLLFHLLCLSFLPLLAQIRLEGTPHTLVNIPPTHRLSLLLVAHHSNSTVAYFSGEAGGQLMRYTNKASEATPVTEATFAGGEWRLPSPQLNCGYFVTTSNGLPKYIWLADYTPYILPEAELSAAHDPADPCGSVVLASSAPFRNISYRAPGGELLYADHLYKVRFPSLLFNEEEGKFLPKEEELEALPNAEGKLTIPASLSDCSYTITGDLYASALGLSPKPLKSQVLPARRLELHTRYSLLNGTQGNTSLSGSLSAPAIIGMEAIANEPAAALVTWRVLRGRERNNDAALVQQQTGAVTQCTLNEMGSYTLYAIVSNREGECTLESESLIVEIESSRLEVPNAFSPHSSPGINDRFRVAHKSIVKFSASIFNQWGNLLYSWTDPNEGWDGNAHGRPVPAGVYYYVIDAVGAEGKEYHLRGHVNIIDSDRQEGTPTP